MRPEATQRDVFRPFPKPQVACSIHAKGALPRALLVKEGGGSIHSIDCRCQTAIRRAYRVERTAGSALVTSDRNFVAVNQVATRRRSGTITNQPAVETRPPSKSPASTSPG